MGQKNENALAESGYYSLNASQLAMYQAWRARVDIEGLNSVARGSVAPPFPADRCEACFESVTGMGVLCALCESSCCEECDQVECACPFDPTCTICSRPTLPGTEGTCLPCESSARMEMKTDEGENDTCENRKADLAALQEMYDRCDIGAPHEQGILAAICELELELEQDLTPAPTPTPEPELTPLRGGNELDLRTPEDARQDVAGHAELYDTAATAPEGECSGCLAPFGTPHDNDCYALHQSLARQLSRYSEPTFADRISLVEALSAGGMISRDDAIAILTAGEVMPHTPGYSQILAEIKAESGAIKFGEGEGT